jgi:hypothetical protein
MSAATVSLDLATYVCEFYPGNRLFRVQVLMNLQLLCCAPLPNSTPSCLQSLVFLPLVRGCSNHHDCGVGTAARFLLVSAKLDKSFASP